MFVWTETQHHGHIKHQEYFVTFTLLSLGKRGDFQSHLLLKMYFVFIDFIIIFPVKRGMIKH